MKYLITTILIIIKLSFSSNAQIINGYTDKQSYEPNEIVTIYASGLPYTNLIPLLKMDGSLVCYISGFENMIIQSPSTSEPWKEGFGYAPTVTWLIPFGFQSGYYLLDGKIPIIIKGDKLNADIVIVCSTNTDAAYTNTGGKSLYYINSSNGVPSTIVSFQRPTQRQGGYMDGFLKWICTKNYNINVISDMDLDNYTQIEHAKLLIVIGHSEYWTRDARNNFDHFVDVGKHAMILSGNTMWWQVSYSTDKSQMICHRGNHWFGGYDDDPICDELQKTYHWNIPSLKFSILGSIGSYWGDGDGNHPMNGDKVDNYYGLLGYNIVLPNSPLLNGTGLIMHDRLQIATTEYDATLVKEDSFGNPILDILGDPTIDNSALGFYRSELIGYDYNNSSQKNRYYPIMVYQRTCNSGIILNVNSTDWCSDVYGMGGTTALSNTAMNCYGLIPSGNQMQLITQNAIDLLLAGSNVFANSPPNSYTITPAATTVGYSACMHGSIEFTPCGVNIMDGYKVDNGEVWVNDNGFGVGTLVNNNSHSFEAKIEDCTSCLRGERLANSNQQNENSLAKIKQSLDPINNQNNLIQIIPNPNNGKFSLNFSQMEYIPFTVTIHNMMGEILYQKDNCAKENLEIDLTKAPKGIYIAKISQRDKVFSKRFIVD